MFVGSMMMPEPIMFTATMNVSCIRFIFFEVDSTIGLALFFGVAAHSRTT